METAIGDLSQVIKYSIVNENMMRGYILDVIEAVEIMSYEKIFHGDLHIRQIFIVLRDNKLKAVIGDFGEHLQIDSPTMHLSELKVFFTSLSEMRGSQQIKNSFDFILKQTVKVELNDVPYDIASIKSDIEQIKKFF